MKINTLPTSHLTSAYNLRLIVNKLTHCANILDKVLTNMHRLYQIPSVLSPLGLSDHSVMVYPHLPDYMTSRHEASPVLNHRLGQIQMDFFADSLLKAD